MASDASRLGGILGDWHSKRAGIQGNGGNGVFYTFRERVDSLSHFVRSKQLTSKYSLVGMWWRCLICECSAVFQDVAVDAAFEALSESNNHAVGKEGKA